jgi:trehalose 6-phosphate phosphatase
MMSPLERLDFQALDPAGLALFLDFDGTLVEIAKHPDQVQISPQTRHALEAMHGMLGGAVAIVSGRDIGDVDRFLSPLSLPVAGVHGLERRRGDGTITAGQSDEEAVARLHQRLLPYVERTEGLMLEKKSGSLALHYRARPELETEAIAAMDEAVHGIGEIHLVRGKMVIEAKGSSANKGGAILEFLAELPFRGRKPFFAGDDVTDEDAFRAVNAERGITVKIGPGETAATYRAADTQAFLDWLWNTVAKLGRKVHLEQP